MAQRKTTTSKSAASSAAEAEKAAKHARLEAARARAAEARIKAQEAAKGRSAGFVNFIREQGVVGLAVGLAIGTAAGDTVKKLVEGFISPIVQFIVGSQQGLEQANWNFQMWGRHADFKWGAFISSAISLLATALVVYLIIHLLKLDRLDKKKEN